MKALKSFVVLPWIAELFELNVSSELVLLPFDIDHFLRVVGLCLFFM